MPFINSDCGTINGRICAVVTFERNENRTNTLSCAYFHNETGRHIISSSAHKFIRFQMNIKTSAVDKASSYNLFLITAANTSELCGQTHSRPVAQWQIVFTFLASTTIRQYKYNYCYFMHVYPSINSCIILQ